MERRCSDTEGGVLVQYGAWAVTRLNVDLVYVSSRTCRRRCGVWWQ